MGYCMDLGVLERKKNKVYGSLGLVDEIRWEMYMELVRFKKILEYGVGDG